MPLFDEMALHDRLARIQTVLVKRTQQVQALNEKCTKLEKRVAELEDQLKVQQEKSSVAASKPSKPRSKRSKRSTARTVPEKQDVDTK